MPETRRVVAGLGVGLALALLMGQYVGGYLDSAAIQDTARDVYYAHAIRNGVFYPLEGPILGGALHLGPAWFYLLALPLWAHESWVAIAVFAGVLASLKFPLAYACGSRLLDRRFGLLWAACLAIPGWNSLETLIFFNPNAAAAAVLLALWLALRVRDHPPSPLEGFTFGLACALAVHVHPTTAPVALLGWLFVSSSRRAGASAGSVVLAMAAGAAVLFLPYAWSQWSGGMPDVPAAASYLAGQLRVENLWNVPMVLATTLLNGVAVVAMRIAGLPQAAAIALAVVFAAPLLALLPLLAARTSAARAARSVAFRLLAWSLLLAAWIAWLRPTTPVYFVYALVPWLAGLVALGLWCLPASGAGRLAVAGFVLLAAGSGIATTFQMAKVVRHGEGVVTSQVLDVKELDPALVHADTWFPASGREALGRFLCSQPKGVALHGHLAFIVDRSVGVDALFACRDASFIALGGQAANLPHWVGLSRRFASRANVRGDCRIGSLEVMRATPHGGPESLAIPDGRRYFPREHGKAAPSRVRREFSAPAGHALLVTNMLHGYESFKGLEVAVSGKRVAPVAGNDLSHLFAPPAGSEASVAWSVSFETTRAGAVDVATFPVTSPGTCAP